MVHSTRLIRYLLADLGSCILLLPVTTTIEHILFFFLFFFLENKACISCVLTLLNVGLWVNLF